MKKLVRCIRRWWRNLRPINIEKQSTIPLSQPERKLVIVRRIRPDGTPYTSVWLIGRHDAILHRLYNYDGQRTPLGKQYDILMRTYNHFIEIRNYSNLRKLYHRCKVQKIIMIQFYLPDI
jgi:hypothetical protein